MLSAIHHQWIVSEKLTNFFPSFRFQLKQNSIVLLHKDLLARNSKVHNEKHGRPHYINSIGNNETSHTYLK